MTGKIIDLKHKLLICGIFFCSAPVLIFFLLFLSSPVPKDKILGASVLTEESSNVFLAQNNYGNIVSSTVLTDSSTPLIIENYLKRYRSPLLPFKDAIILYSQKYNVNPKLIVAIAQQESNLGKISPENCYNAWGWGIHAGGTTCFSNWDEAIETVTRGISKSYCTKGLCDNPCEMMKKYTPKSNGSWCFGINHFLEEMETGNF